MTTTPFVGILLLLLYPNCGAWNFPQHTSTVSTRQFPPSSTSLHLDSKDIIENDADFLVQLRSNLVAAQMENNAVVSSNPREITNRIKDFFYSPRAGNEDSSQPRSYYKRSKQEIELFSIYINSNKNELDAVNAILIIEGCHRSQNISPKDGARATSLSNAGGINIKDICGWPVLLRAMEKSSPHLTSSMIYRGISSMKYANLEKGMQGVLISQALTLHSHSTHISHVSLTRVTHTYHSHISLAHITRVYLSQRTI